MQQRCSSSIVWYKGNVEVGHRICATILNLGHKHTHTMHDHAWVLGEECETITKLWNSTILLVGMVAVLEMKMPDSCMRPAKSSVPKASEPPDEQPISMLAVSSATMTDNQINFLKSVR